MLVLTEFERKPLLFKDPKEVISCHKLDEVKGCFEKMESAISSGHYLAGFFSYEAGYAFEEKLRQDKTFEFPLLQFGVYTSPLRYALPHSLNEVGVRNLKLNISPEGYFKDIQTIKKYIEKGDTYQITYCLKFKFDIEGDPYSLYRRLLKEQPMPYPAYIQTDDFTIASLSPELFLKKRGDFILSKPMKGTWPRGGNFWEDLWAKRKLHFDPKNRAENIMIADLLRNDLGKLGDSVKWPRIWEVARYKTLCQMTSTISARVDRDLSLYKLFSALHPSGSVTGAPKLRSMEIIRELEKEERKIYTGAIGYITPDKDLFFNIPIRTLLINDQRGLPAEALAKAGEMGVGGGIVWDSTPEGELEECYIKARFLTSAKASPYPRSCPAK